MIEHKISFGVFMMVENTITLTLIGDLIRRISLKIMLIRHPHVYWNSGVIFLVYLLLNAAYVSLEAYSSYSNYILSKDPFELDIVVSRVSLTTFLLAAKSILWYYTIKYGFNLFKDKNEKIIN